MNHLQLARRIFNRPHLVEPGYARVFVGALADRLGVRSLTDEHGAPVPVAEAKQAAADFVPREGRGIVDTVEGIAIIPVEGTLMHRYGHIDPFSGATGYDGIQAKLEAALSDPSVRGILLDIDSPGGEVSGAFDLTDFIYESRSIKPIWAVADELAASAAYSLASGAERIIAPRTAELGSVGVLTMHVDQSQMVKEMGLDVTFIHAGAHKVDGNPFEPLPEDVRADIQAEIDALYDLFTGTVARNRRGMSEDAVRETEARVYNARDATDVGFVDEIMAAREVLPAFDEYLTDRSANRTIFMQGVKDMSLSLFVRGRRKAAEEETETPPEVTDDEGEETTTSAGEDPEGAGGDNTGGGESEPEPKAASAEAIVGLCAEGNVHQLAQGLIQSRATLEEAKAAVKDARDIRDACAAAGLPHLADHAISAISEGRFAGFIRAALTEATAGKPGGELDHHQPSAGGPAAGAKDWSDAYANT